MMILEDVGTEKHDGVKYSQFLWLRIWVSDWLQLATYTTYSFVNMTTHTNSNQPTLYINDSTREAAAFIPLNTLPINYCRAINLSTCCNVYYDYYRYKMQPCPCCYCIVPCQSLSSFQLKFQSWNLFSFKWFHRPIERPYIMVGKNEENTCRQG